MLFGREPVMVTADQALAGRDTPMAIAGPHLALGNPITPPWPDGHRSIVLGMGCFWGAERVFWRLPGVWTTAVGYAGGFTPNPTYEETCTGRTGHTEAVLVVFDPEILPTAAVVSAFWEGHDPTTANRQGNDRGTQYRSALWWDGDDQRAVVEQSAQVFGQRLAEAGRNPITTEMGPAPTFYYAEPYHQQYLVSNPNGYCGLGGTGVSCPVGLLAD